MLSFALFLSKWTDSEFKKGETDAMVFGTAKRLSMTSKCISIKYTCNIISNGTTYKYLGSQLDRNLNFDENFEWAYRKASGRLHLLAKLRCHLTTLAAMKIFDMVIMPLLTYISIINLKLIKTQSDKLLSLERRASKIIGKKVKSIECIIKKTAINMVYKVLMNDNVWKILTITSLLTIMQKTPETKTNYRNCY